MDITFNWISYKNIMSVGAAPIRVQLDESAKTLVTGSNGAGKSTMIEALSFLMYGKPYRKLKKDQLINQINKKNLHTEGELTIGGKVVHIERGIKPTIFKVTVDGEPIPEAASAIEYQRILEEDILKVSHESFKQLIVLGTAGYTPFMELKPEQRRTMVEDLLKLSVLGQMNKLNNVELKQVNTAYDLVSVEMTGLENEYRSIEKSIEEQKASNEAAISQQTEQVKTLVSRIHSAKGEIEKLKGSLVDLVEPDSSDIDEIVKRIEQEYLDSGHVLRLSIDNTKHQISGVESKYDELIEQAKNEVVDESSFLNEIKELESTLIDDKILDDRISGLKSQSFEVPKPEDNRIKIDVSLGDRKTVKTSRLFELDFIIKEKTKALENFADGVCPTCGTDVSDGHSHVDEIRDELESAKSEKEKVESEISEITVLIDADKAAVRASEEEYTASLTKWSNEEKEFNQSISDEVLKEQRKVSEHNSGVREKIGVLKTRLETISGETKRKISSLETQKSNEMIDLKTKLSTTQSQLDRIDIDKDRKITDLTAEHNRKVEDIARQRAVIESTIAATEKSIVENTEMAKFIKDNIDNLKSKVFESPRMAEVQSILSEKAKENEELFNQKFSCGILKDMLKDDAIKGDIVKKYIPLFNSKINEYLGITGADYVFSLNESFEETIKSRGRDEFTYMSFSQGEKARINIALLFTWRYIASLVSGTNISMLILDEIFDGGMDSEGVYAVNRLLNEIGGNTFIISHRVENRDDSFTSHMKMTKKGRFTVMERE
ncbi:SbcC-like subunit of palindrome specific endonuclease [Aeromonas phage CC2]|uniref:Endonuclease subunit n=1 Tax=Aeromonas phage CC2 TaxID=1204516 RepID=I6XLW6_9CAUD|nr:SbcC-like subunit of palindrome specific endonuclease [Aeromonas phage CC2]AFN39519.1 endonuclease subunit [Aeromonas phage CC2]